MTLARYAFSSRNFSPASRICANCAFASSSSLVKNLFNNSCASLRSISGCLPSHIASTPFAKDW